MLIYLVEDDSLKATLIEEFLAQNFSNADVCTYGSFQSGLKNIQRLTPDVVLLDMTLPTFDRLADKREGRSRPLGGYDLMRKLKLKEISTKVIVVTQLVYFGEGDNLVTFDELSIQCKREFSDFFVGSVQFRQSETDWQRDLYQLLIPFYD